MRQLSLTDTVYLKKCDSYEKQEVKSVINELLENVCKDNSFDLDFTGKKVALKPNLLAKRTPDAVITTEPEIVKAAAEFFKSRGADVVLCDSPGGAYTNQLLSSIYKTTGMEEAANETGITLNKDLGYSEVAFPSGKTAKSFNIITPLVEADLIVNLARLKTHAMCEMTASVKNLFGSIPGLQKAEQHARFPKRKDFASQLVDLCLANSPQVNIIDAIVAMEGNGPAGGVPKKVGAILASANPFALDLLGASLMGYKPNEVGTVEDSIKRGLCPDNISKLNIIGENPEDYTHEFVRPDGSAGGLLKQLPSILGGRIQKMLEPHPVVINSKCVGCGECVAACPEKTMEIREKKAFIYRDKCIKCYCCQELCPKKAIEVKRSIFFRLGDIFSKKKS